MVPLIADVESPDYMVPCVTRRDGKTCEAHLTPAEAGKERDGTIRQHPMRIPASRKSYRG